MMWNPYFVEYFIRDKERVILAAVNDPRRRPSARIVCRPNACPEETLSPGALHAAAVCLRGLRSGPSNEVTSRVR